MSKCAGRYWVDYQLQSRVNPKAQWVGVNRYTIFSRQHLTSNKLLPHCPGQITHATEVYARHSVAGPLDISTEETRNWLYLDRKALAVDGVLRALLVVGAEVKSDLRHLVAVRQRPPGQVHAARPVGHRERYVVAVVF